MWAIALTALLYGVAFAENPPQYVTQWGAFGLGNGQFNQPFGVAVDASGNVYVADTRNHRIQKFSNAGAYLAQWGTEGSGPGQFELPYAVATDAGGNVYVADTYNSRVQKFTAAGAFLTEWGSAGNAPGQFSKPVGIAVDASSLAPAGSANVSIQPSAPDLGAMN